MCVLYLGGNPEYNIPYWLYQFVALLIRKVVFLDAIISIIHSILCCKYLFLKCRNASYCPDDD